MENLRNYNTSIFKYLLISALLLGTVTCTFSQTVNGKPISEIEAEYVQIVGTAKFLSNKVTIQIDFGQEDKLFNSKDTQVVDENGKSLTLNSMIDALNFMSKSGYEFVDAYVITVSNQNIYHYMLKRRSD